MTSPPITYRVDASDRIVHMNDAWDAFAHQNDGAAVTAAQVVGRSLWDFVSDLTTRAVYRQALKRIRAGSEMCFSFRCDSPSCRRMMEMQISLVDDAGSVEFRSVLIAESDRQLPPLGDGASGDEEPLQRVCGWCNRFDVDGVWMEIEEALPQLRLMERASLPRVTHGMCESCFEKMTEEVARL
jgi:hypothetical protein